MLNLKRIRNTCIALCASISLLVPAVPVSAAEMPVADTPSAGWTFTHPTPTEIANRPDAPLNTDLYRQQYSKQMGGNNALSGYMINAQPNSAIVFDANTYTAVVCDPAAEVNQATPRGYNGLSPNYTTGVLDLPRLTSQYYYSIIGYKIGTKQETVNNEEEGAYGLSVKRTLYPTLTWTRDIPELSEVYLAVMSADTNSQQRQITVRFASEQPALPSSWHDCSEFVLEDALNPDYNAIYQTENITYYPAELHRSCIVTSQFIVGHNDIWAVNADGQTRNIFGWFVKQFNTSSGSNTPVPEYLALNKTFVTYPNFQNGAVTTDVRELVWPYIHGSQKPEYFAVFMPHGTGVTYNSNKGTVSTVNNNVVDHQYNIGDGTKVYKGVYAVCYGDSFNVFAVENTAFSGNLNSISDSAPSKTFDNGSVYNVEEEFLGKFGYRTWANAMANQGFDVSEYPNVKYTGTERKTINAYNTAMAYGGVIGNAYRLTAEAPIAHYTVVTRYQAPDSTSSELIKCEELSIALNTPAPSLKQPTTSYPMYTFDRWYTDQACTVVANMQTIHQNAKDGDVIQLYGKYNYTGGTYTVQFYNDATGESSSSTFECREKPTLPPTPTRTGYLFRNWVEVYNTSSTSGTDYVPDNFNPVKDRNYIFKTFWDVQGVITNVTSNKNEYYVGDSIDKSAVVVTVQTDNNGTTRTLGVDEFTVSPEKVNSAGRNQIQVTYTATGATATFDVTGKAVTPVSLTARYTGSALNVGATISRSNVTCTVNYNNGTSETVTDFTLAPTTIASAGANTIRVIYGSLSTTITVTGNRPSGGTSGGGTSAPRPTTPTTGGNKPSNGSTTGTGNKPTTGNKPNGTGSNTRARLQSITAYYKGAQPYVGDVLKANDIEVTASYQDGSTTTLSSTAFQFSPSYVRNDGENTITVSYGGLTTTFTVSALLKSDNTLQPDGVSNTGTPTTTSTGRVIGVDANGNPIYEGSEGSGGTYTGSANTQDTGTVLGNPLTGAGMPSGNKGTSTGYLNGSNILTTRLYGGAVTEENKLDILAEINAAGDTASSVDIQLMNGAGGNDITAPMLEALKEKDLTLNINMMNPDDEGLCVGQWSVYGGSLTDTSKQFNPNITFEVTDKGSEILTYIAVADGEYPDNVQLNVFPALGTYASGEAIRVYTCGFDKSEAHFESMFSWSDAGNTLAFDVTKSKRYALSNALDAYPEGGSLTMDISRPSEAEESEEEVTDDTTDDTELEGEEPFDWGDDPVAPPAPADDEKSGIPLIPIVAGILAVLALGGGAVCFTLLRKARATADVQEPTDFDDYAVEEDDVDFDEEGEEETDFEDSEEVEEDTEE